MGVGEREMETLRGRVGVGMPVGEVIVTNAVKRKRGLEGEEGERLVEEDGGDGRRPRKSLKMMVGEFVLGRVSRWCQSI